MGVFLFLVVGQRRDSRWFLPAFSLCWIALYSFFLLAAFFVSPRFAPRYSPLLIDDRVSSPPLLLALPTCLHTLQTDEERKLAQQPEAASPPRLRVVVVDSSSSSTPSPGPTTNNAESASTSTAPATATAATPAEAFSAGSPRDGGVSVAGGRGGQEGAPRQQAAGDGGSGGGEEGSGDGEVVVRVPLESLDPEAYCLTPVRD